jgi:hypothetical protein
VTLAARDHAGQGEDAPIQIILEAGGLRVGPQGIALYHPEVRPAVVQQDLGVIHHAPVNARHGKGDADEQSQAQASEDKLAPGVEDVPSGETDH